MGKVSEYRWIIVLTALLLIFVFLVSMISSTITGHVIGLSDIQVGQSIHNYPISRGIILAIPFYRIFPLFSKARSGDWRGDLEHAYFRIDEDFFKTNIKAWTTLQPDGGYRLQISPGIYYVCLANLTIPVLITGCVNVRVWIYQKEKTIDLLFNPDAGRVTISPN